MTDVQRREAARQFIYKWNGRGNEDQDARSYWIDILQNILGIENVTDRVDFEKKVIGPDGNTKRIDVYIPETHVLIEQKSLGIALDKPQAGHNGMTPYEQAKMYDNGLPFGEKSRWIVTSNFAEIWIYDMTQKRPEPLKLALADLQSKYHLLEFLVNKQTKVLTDEMQVSLQAGELVGVLYDAFLKQYKNPEDKETLKSLNKLCVRLVFCLYAEDAGLFGRKNLFHDYLAQYSAKNARKALSDLFRVLDQKPEERDPYLADDDPLLAAFPYVNGGLFADEDVEIPPFTDELLSTLLQKASGDFDWRKISPTIFGAVFESTLNPETRRSGGMHYTSVENIHKVIDPLFLDDLKAEYAEIDADPVAKTRIAKLRSFQARLASLTFLDPACGSGNFLTETYLSLRKLENQIIESLLALDKGSQAGQIILGEYHNPIQVSIGQFYGIEINDFAVTVAKTALWIAESQMLRETENIIRSEIDFLPLKSYANIVEANALRIDWADVVPKEKLNYIMGNPPFVGKKYQSSFQKEDMKIVFGMKSKGVGNLDYVTAWYEKAAAIMKGNGIVASFVSTNSIVQGEHIPLFWKRFYENYNVQIVFAYQTFKWNSESKDAAAVHCVIIGFTIGDYTGKRFLFSGNTCRNVSIIHPYLQELPMVFVENRSKPIGNTTPLVYGSFALDDGNYTISEKEYNEIIELEPQVEKYLKLFIGSEEYINGKKRYCVWLKNANISEVRSSRILSNKVKNVQKWREASKRKETVAAATTPMLFAEIRQPDSDYLAIPITSSERRRYIPMGYMKNYIIASNHLLVLPNATMFEFGVLISNVHMAWMRLVAGRLELRYNYSARVVYNNFPWPELTEEQRTRIEQTAQAILDARALYPDCSLADLYDETTMPPELRRAHQANDRAVMQAYGFDIKTTTEASCVAELMKRYQALTAQESGK